MGTRGFIGFLTPERELRGSYNHFDSYPTSLGSDLQIQLKRIFIDRTRHGWDRVREKAAAIRWVDAQEDPSDEDRERYQELWQEVSTGKDWYSLLRDAQGKLDFMLEHGIATANHDFPRDSLFCEWGYLLDLKEEQVVILIGFNTDESKQAEYCKASEDHVLDQEKRIGNRYYGCRELWRGSIDEFLALDMKELEEKEDAEEES